MFDAGFFGISPVVASGMGPQPRLLLEVSYEACESAGVSLEQLRGWVTSVHAGSMTSDYSVIQARDTETLPKYDATGTSSNSTIANRVSYVLDLKGPSVTIDAACSSSLVALHRWPSSRPGVSTFPSTSVCPPLATQICSGCVSLRLRLSMRRQGNVCRNCWTALGAKRESDCE